MPTLRMWGSTGFHRWVFISKPTYPKLALQFCQSTLMGRCPWCHACVPLSRARLSMHLGSRMASIYLTIVSMRSWVLRAGITTCAFLPATNFPLLPSVSYFQSLAAATARSRMRPSRKSRRGLARTGCKSGAPTMPSMHG
jgi:hypothetical protein